MPASLPLEVPLPKENSKYKRNRSSKKKARSKREDTHSTTAATSTDDSSLAALTAGLKADGVARLNGVLSPATACSLRLEVLRRRDVARAEIAEEGADWRSSFADVLLKNKRCDLLLPLKGARGVQLALRELLVCGNPALAKDEAGGNAAETPLFAAISCAVGEDAVLYEFACLISEPGSPRQPVHPDNPFQEQTPLLTCFVGLQDIKPSMGPTVFLPGTHTAAAHQAFDALAPGTTGDGYRLGSRDAFLSSSRSVEALLGAGDAALFDSRTLHCGGANLEGDKGGGERAIFYLSFRNPRAAFEVGNVGSISREVYDKQYTLSELRRRLSALRDDGDGGDGEAFDPFDDAPKEAEAFAELFRLATDREEGSGGDPAAQFNLALCYKRGEGVEQSDSAAAAHWFLKAAEQGTALAQTNLGFAHYLGEGVPQDAREAVKWWELAAAQGEANAQHNLGVCLSEGSEDCDGAVVVPRDPARALGLFGAAASQGHAGAKQRMEEVVQGLSSLL